MTNDFQSLASKSGRTYREHVAEVLRVDYGCTILGTDVRHPSNVEFDIHCRTANGIELGIECKASATDHERSGMRRSDNVWKVGGYLHQLAYWHCLNPSVQRVRYMVITSSIPDKGTVWDQMLNGWVLHGDLELMVIPYPKDDPTLAIA